MQEYGEKEMIRRWPRNQLNRIVSKAPMNIQLVGMAIQVYFLAQPVKIEFTKHLFTTDCYSWLLQLSYTTTNIIGYLNWFKKTNAYKLLHCITDIYIVHVFFF